MSQSTVEPGGRADEITSFLGVVDDWLYGFW